MPKSKDTNRTRMAFMDIRWGVIQFFIVSIAFLAIGISTALSGSYLIGFGCAMIATFYLVLGAVKLLNRRS